MNNNYPQIQELLHQKADYQARLKLLPYDGTPEIKERDGKKYLYVWHWVICYLGLRRKSFVFSVITLDCPSTPPYQEKTPPIGVKKPATEAAGFLSAFTKLSTFRFHSLRLQNYHH